MTMPYIIGVDPETDEILVGDIRDHGFFLRGSKDSEEKIRKLISAANNWTSRPRFGCRDSEEKTRKLISEANKEQLMSGQTLAIAVRCQLLTGSYDGATRSCSCPSTRDCFLSREELEKYGNHDKVLEAKHRNLEEFNDV